MDTTTTPHQFLGRSDRDCEFCGRPDRDPIHNVAEGQVSTYIEPASGRSDVVRLIQTTDELLHEVLRRPGQLFVVSHGLRAMRGSSSLEQWTYIEFANGDKVEVRYAR